jgi:hypothetical protein
VTIRQALPLPECRLCEQPTRRDVYDRNGELCTRCADGITDTVRMLPVRDVDTVADLQAARARRQEENEQTAYVERYLPPVPGQLQLGEDQ